MTNERYIKLLVDELGLEYSALLESDFIRQPNDKYDCALQRFISTLMYLSDALKHWPEELSVNEMKTAMNNSADTVICKKVLLDCTLNEALITLAKPIDLAEVYRKTFDRSYSYIPKDKRPAANFMNLPEEGVRWV